VEVPRPEEAVMIAQADAQGALEYVQSYKGTFGFMLSLQTQLEEYGELTEKQLIAALKCKANDRGDHLAKKVPTSVERVVRNGYYTIRESFSDGKDHLTLRVTDCTFEDKPKGTQFVAVLTGPDNTSSYQACGFIFGREFQMFSRFENGYVDWKRAIEALLRTNGEFYGKEYALQSTRCYICNALLTTPDSILHGTGPICGGRE
jgi:hypothetical protein